MQEIIQTRLFASEAGLPQLTLLDEDSLGVRRTLRLQSGDRIACFNGDGMEYVYEMNESSRNSLRLSLIHTQTNPRDPIPKTCLWIAATKGKTKDRMVRDLTPLGVTRIAFYRADRSVCLPQPDAQPRLQKIAIEACRQCGRSTIPSISVLDINLPMLFASEKISPSQTILFWEQCNSSFPVTLPAVQDEIALIFGPEGGFSEKETQWFQSIPLPIATLGKRILRAELAVVVGTTLFQSARGLLC